ncbi:MAG: peptide ABC transporter substrate-binding protein [Oscillospiraceae bacterium]|nr:peptide ABC transporter substrate-binding protein [Oscillospiraceae bacterium]
MAKRFCALLLSAVLLAALFSGCGEGLPQEQILRCDLSASPRLLDPQLASTPEELLVIENTFEGLLRQDGAGSLGPGVAVNYTVSEDGCTYVFDLRENAMWSDGETPVTAMDFVCAFRRLLDPATQSPYAGDYVRIRGGAQVLAGEMDPSGLGVYADGDHTLRIELESPDAFFPQLTAAAAAMPCNQKFFESSRGKYGLDTEYLLFNGPFVIRTWDPKRSMQLRRSETYFSAAQAVPAGVNLYFGQAEATLRFLTGVTDAAAISHGDLIAAQAVGASCEKFEDTLWYLAFNTRHAPWDNEKLRQAFAMSLAPRLFEGSLPSYYARSLTLVPPAVTLGGGSYRSLDGSDFDPIYDPDAAAALLRQATEELGLTRMPAPTLLYPDLEGFPALMGQLQAAVQQSTGMFFNIEALPPDELEARLQSGDYDMAITSSRAQYDSPESLLGLFSSDSAQNVTGFSNPELERLLTHSREAATLAEAGSYFQAAELLLLRQAPAIPLFVETSCYASARGVTGVRFSPFSYRMFFQFATKKK